MVVVGAFAVACWAAGGNGLAGRVGGKVMYHSRMLQPVNGEHLFGYK